MRTQWWLRCTTSSYERSVVETVLAQKEWLEYRHYASPMFDIYGSTPVFATFLLGSCINSSVHWIKVVIIICYNPNYCFHDHSILHYYVLFWSIDFVNYIFPWHSCLVKSCYFFVLMICSFVFETRYPIRDL